MFFFFFFELKSGNDSVWPYGVDDKTLKDLIEFWRSDFIHRWTEMVEKINNEMPQFKTQIDGIVLFYYLLPLYYFFHYVYSVFVCIYFFMFLVIYLFLF
jgi:hypothetical protein